MSDDVSVDEVALFCCTAGLPWQETLWLRGRLSSRTISRQLFTLLRRRLLAPSRPTLYVNDDLRLLHAGLLFHSSEERRDCLTLVANVGVATRHLPCFTVVGYGQRTGWQVTDCQPCHHGPRASRWTTRCAVTRHHRRRHARSCA